MTNTTHEVAALIARYNQLVAADSKSTEEWQAVGFALDALLDQLTGSTHEMVRARAVDALATARRLIRTGGN